MTWYRIIGRAHQGPDQFFGWAAGERARLRMLEAVRRRGPRDRGGFLLFVEAVRA